MRYLLAEEYERFGLPTSTPEGMVAAASAILDAHCRRKSLVVERYSERLRVGRSQRVRLTYLPLADGDGGPIVQARARRSRRTDCGSVAAEVAHAFGLAGGWVDLDVATLNFCRETGEVQLSSGVLSPTFDDVEITYTAGFESVPDAVKHACALVVCNAQATPALNVRGGSLDTMHLEYFSDSLLDSNVRKLLAPYVAQRVG